MVLGIFRLWRLRVFFLDFAFGHFVFYFLATAAVSFTDLDHTTTGSNLDKISLYLEVYWIPLIPPRKIIPIIEWGYYLYISNTHPYIWGML